MKKGVFITGTDTGVGKTYVGAGIAAALRAHGMDVGVMKPAETGCSTERGSLVPHDAQLLMKAAGVGDPLDLVVPYRFQEPLAPAVAAEREGRTIAFSKVMTAFRMLSERHGFMIVEGAGGILVPLTGRRSYLDLAASLSLPVLVVARPGLGTINHTLLTVTALRSRRIAIAGIVINHCGTGQPGLAERTNPAVIERLSRVPVIGIVRHRQKDLEDLVRSLR
jgi:dethiobiotin synthetase